MKTKIILVVGISVLFAFSAIAQQNGIQFEKSICWQDVLAKAKSEHKFIFVDCYATWCGPCKEMDRSTYPIDSVGTFVNEHFISVKVQMDRTSADSDRIKGWYNDAKKLEDSYTVNAYPTLLFFDGNGKVVHRSVGFQNAQRFMQNAKNAIDPNRQYYTLFALYESNRLPMSSMPVLAKEATALDNKELGEKVAGDYIRDDIEKLDQSQLLSKQNTDFITVYSGALTSQDRFFKLCYDEPAMIDTAMHNKGYADWLVNKVIYQQEIAPKLTELWNNGPEPNWAEIFKSISQKFNHPYAEKNVLNAKVNWYKHVKDAKSYSHFLTIKIDRGFRANGVVSPMAANSYAFEVFQYDDDKKDLETALTWIDAAIKFPGQPPAYEKDTKANLLYKLGKKQEAVELELQAAQLDPGDKEIAEALKKMQSGQPTWPDKMQ